MAGEKSANAIVDQYRLAAGEHVIGVNIGERLPSGAAHLETRKNGVGTFYCLTSVE